MIDLVPEEPITGPARRKSILDTVDDLVSDFMYYDRKEDEELPEDAIENAIEAGEITIDDIVAKFCECLESAQ